MKIASTEPPVAGWQTFTLLRRKRHHRLKVAQSPDLTIVQKGLRIAREVRMVSLNSVPNFLTVVNGGGKAHNR